MHHLYRALQPASEVLRFAPRIRLFRQIQQIIFAAINGADVSEVLPQARHILAEEMAVHAYELRWSRVDPDTPIGEFDLSKINLDELSRNMQPGNAYLQAERLRSLLNQRLQQMIHVNPRRINYLDRLEALIDKHNETSANNADYPAELIELARAVQSEEQRATREALSEEELALADLLIAEHAATADDWPRLKTIARDLLAKLKSSGHMAHNWYNKDDLKAGVLNIIRDALNTLPDSYSRAQYLQKVDEVARHVRSFYANYGSDGPLSA